MNLLFPALKRAVPSFNDRPHTEVDFWRICRRHRIRVHQLPLGTPGFFKIEADGTCHIYLNSRLKGIEWLDAAFHELGHFFLHTPLTSRTAYYYRLVPKTKQEYEAQSFSDIMLIPKCLMFEILESPEHMEDWGYAERIINGRTELYSRYLV